MSHLDAVPGLVTCRQSFSGEPTFSGWKYRYVDELFDQVFRHTYIQGLKVVLLIQEYFFMFLYQRNIVSDLVSWDRRIREYKK